MPAEDTRKNGTLHVISVQKEDAADAVADWLTTAYIDPEEEDAKVFGGAGVITPPVKLSHMFFWGDHSPTLPRCFEAYATNIDGFGNRIESIYEFAGDKDIEAMRQAMVLEQYLGDTDDPLLALDNDVPEATVPTDEEVLVVMDGLRRREAVERFALKTWFDSLCEGTFIALRRKTRIDLETCGNGYWEILRTKDNKPRRVNHLPAENMRLRPKIAAPVQIEERVQVSPLTWKDRKINKKFRTFVEALGDGKLVYFKEFGDTRVISRKTGKVYVDMAAFDADQDKPDGDLPATEVIHFKLYAAGSSYGQPRWIGTSESVVGQRKFDGVNRAYADNNTVPALAVMVHGGRATAETVKNIKDHIKKLKGSESFQSVLVLEGEPFSVPGEKPGVVKIEIQPLTHAQEKDGLFLEYDLQATDKIRSAFRLPPIVIGDTKDFNKATASAAMRQAEEQVFQPEREAFDAFLNKTLLVNELGIRLVKFRSLSPTTQDPEVLGKLVALMVQQGILTPAEAREIVSGVFNRDFDKIMELWTQQPLALTQQGFAFWEDPNVEPDDAQGDGSVQQGGQDGAEDGGEGEGAASRQVVTQAADLDVNGAVRVLLAHLMKVQHQAGVQQQIEIDFDQQRAELGVK